MRLSSARQQRQGGRPPPLRRWIIVGKVGSQIEVAPGRSIVTRKRWRKPEPIKPLGRRPWAVVAVRNSITTGLSSPTAPSERRAIRVARRSIFPVLSALKGGLITRETLIRI